ncbi:MAG: metallophosphoesterase [Solobacterium sp.]|nr:metallophosphoesterase [Solobacterium sp.]
MIYVTGDIHGYIDIRKLLENDVTNKITKDDYVIICGDFGLVYDYQKENRKERKWLNWLNGKPWTTLFVDGNHECFPRLNALPVREWKGGKIHVVRDKIFHLMRGEIFDIDGTTIFAMGGAASHDRGPAAGDTAQVIGKFWWPEEIPSKEEMDYALKNLEKHGNQVDYIITHCMPTLFQDFIKQGTFPPDEMSEFLEKVRVQAEFKHWYSGHYHYNIDLNGQFAVVFSRILPIGSTIRDSEIITGVPKYRKNEAVLFEQNGELVMGTIKTVSPYGTLFKHDEPYYDISIFGDNWPDDVATVRESSIMEKSLMTF